jgi:hypothetical protein
MWRHGLLTSRTAPLRRFERVPTLSASRRMSDAIFCEPVRVNLLPPFGCSSGVEAVNVSPLPCKGEYAAVLHPKEGCQ